MRQALPASAFILTQIEHWMASRTEAGRVHLLDLACGTGRHISAVLNTDAAADMVITAADINTACLETLRQRLAEQADVRLVAVDLEQDGLVLGEVLGRRSFDIVIVTNYLHRPLLGQIFRLVSPGGILLYETFGQGQEAYGKPSNPAFLLGETELATALPDTFSVVHHFFGQRQTLYPDRPPAIICQLAARRTS